MKNLDSIIAGTFYLLFFLVPLVFTADTSELFEYNKMMTVYALTIVIAATWLIKMISAGKFIYKRTFLEIPLLAYLGAHFLSTLFSIDPHVSLWGYYSRFHEGSLATLSYITLYFAAVSNLNAGHVKKIFYASFASAALVSVYGALEHFGHSPSCLFITGKFGVDCWIQDVKNRVFATLGQPNWMAAYLNVIIFTALVFRRRFLFLIALFLAALWFTKSRSGFAGLAAGGAVLVFLIVKIKPQIKIAIAVITFIAAAAFGWQWYGNLPTVIPGNITGSEAIRKPVWEGAVRVWQRYPVFGSGVETFAYSFYKDRPASKNLDSEWDFLYNKAHNEYLNLLATTGTLGMLAYLALIAAIAWVCRKTPALLAAFATILVTNFFGFSVVIIGLYFFLIPAWASILASRP